MTWETAIYVIGCDVGTQSTKALLLGREGRVVARASSGYSTSHPHPGWAEQLPADWRRAVTACVRSLLSQAGGARPDAVRALGVAAQVDGIVAVGADEEPVAPAPIWMDRRATLEARRLGEQIGPGEIRSITGLNVDASHGAPKIAWLREHAAGAVAAYFVPGSYLVNWLTGERAIDHANASCLLLYDVTRRTWSRPLLEAAELDPAALDRIADATDVVGMVRPAVAEELGVSQACRVVVGTGDEHAACVAAGVLRPGIVGDIVGTAEPVAVAAERPVVDPLGLLETHGHVPADRWLIENPGFVSAGSVRWLAQAVLGCGEEEIEALAAATPAGADGVLFLPELGGATTPRWNDEARGAFTGLALGHGRGHLARAVLEGCAYAFRDVVDRLDALDLGGDVVRVVGGGARNRTWLQAKADVTGRRLECLTEPEASALGAALTAAVGVGWWDNLDEASAATIRLDPIALEPNPATRSVYADAYARYLTTFDALEPEPGRAGS